jgi:hypothetical protein
MPFDLARRFKATVKAETLINGWRGVCGKKKAESAGGRQYTINMSISWRIQGCLYYYSIGKTRTCFRIIYDEGDWSVRRRIFNIPEKLLYVASMKAL